MPHKHKLPERCSLAKNEYSIIEDIRQNQENINIATLPPLHRAGNPSTEVSNYQSCARYLYLDNDGESKLSLGNGISSGANGIVYEDTSDEDYLYKQLCGKLTERKIGDFMNEAELFSRYYGEGTAHYFKKHDKHYIRMLKIPGDSLSKLSALPINSGELYGKMIGLMHDRGIDHADLHLDNILYDVETKQFFPVDFSNKKSFLSLTPNDKKERNEADQEVFNEIVEAIHSKILSVRMASGEDIKSLFQKLDAFREKRGTINELETFVTSLNQPEIFILGTHFRNNRGLAFLNLDSMHEVLNSEKFNDFKENIMDLSKRWVVPTYHFS